MITTASCWVSSKCKPPPSTAAAAAGSPPPGRRPQQSQCREEQPECSRLKQGRQGREGRGWWPDTYSLGERGGHSGSSGG